MAVAPFAAADVPVSAFDTDGLTDWSVRDFNGETHYTVTADHLSARTDGGASALYREVTVDLERFPCLSWRWRISGVFAGNEAERTRAGDDYPARVYVVFDTGIGFWNTRAVNYVWSSTQPVGMHWPNAYTDRAGMIAVASGDARTGRWVHQHRDVAADYRRLFGEAPPDVAAVAVMTDGDDLGVSATADYADIHFRAASSVGRACRPPGEG